jgi:hypothetical protein
MKLTAAYTTIAATSIAAVVERKYRIGPIARCRFFVRGMSDFYEFEGGDGGVTWREYASAGREDQRISITRQRFSRTWTTAGSSSALRSRTVTGCSGACWTRRRAPVSSLSSNSFRVTPPGQT